MLRLSYTDYFHNYEIPIYKYYEEPFVLGNARPLTKDYGLYIIKYNPCIQNTFLYIIG